MVNLAADIWREHNIAGNPLSLQRKPPKSEVREWGTWVEASIAFSTRAEAGAASVGPVIRIFVRGHTVDGLGGAWYKEVTDTGTLEAWQFRSNGSTRRWQIDEPVGNPFMLGAVGDGTTDDQAAFTACAAFFKTWYIPTPAVSFNVSGTTTISLPYSLIYGNGRSSLISASSANLPIFKIGGAAIFGTQIRDLLLTRSVTATAGGYGVDFSDQSVSNVLIDRVHAEKQFIGFNLGPTTWSEMVRCLAERNVGPGFQFVNTASNGTCQWSLETCLSQMNGAQGYILQSIAGPSQMTCGTFKNCATFANSAAGFAAVGLVAVPVSGIRIVGGFYGSDAYSGIYLNTYGDQHLFEGVVSELAGTEATGPLKGVGAATAASNIGSGFEVTANNKDVQFTGCHASANSQDGFYLSALSHHLGNCRAKDNGLAAGDGRRNGVNTIGGNTTIVGGRFGNTGAGASQTHGAFFADGSKASLGFADLTGNATAAWGATANLNLVQSIGNLPNTLGVQLSGGGAVILGNPTGGFAAAGTENVAGGLLKNNTAYTNP